MEKTVLVLGGTGAIGIPLVKSLSERGFIVYVTSRKKRDSFSNVNYIQGNAHDFEFIKKVLSDTDYDVIVDFMIYSLPEFEERAELFLKRTKQYIFMSSARVYAATDNLITEDTPRLLDVCEDQKYIASKEYAIRKAKEENVLFSSSNNNWTIVRPSITYNTDRLQAPLEEKEGWLFRALHGQTVVFSSDLSEVVTTMTCGNDVAMAISKLVDNPRALGEAVHIAGANSITWGKVFEIYLNALDKENIHPKVKYIRNSERVSIIAGNKNQYKYARAINRRFDNSKLFSIIGNMEFISAEEGLSNCVREFINGKRVFGRIPARLFGYYDRITHEVTPLKVFSSKKDQLVYFYFRYIRMNKDNVLMDKNKQ